MDDYADMLPPQTPLVKTCAMAIAQLAPCVPFTLRGEMEIDLAARDVAFEVERNPAAMDRLVREAALAIFGSLRREDDATDDDVPF